MTPQTDGDTPVEPELDPLIDGEPRLAARAAAALLLLLAPLSATLALPQPESPHTALAIVIAGVAAVIGALLLTPRAARLRPPGLFAVDLLALALIAAYVAGTGGAHSLYAPLYVLVAIHAAAFLPTRWALPALVLTLDAFLVPLAYDGTDRPFGEIAAVAGPVVLVGAAAIHLALARSRSERDRLAEREEQARRLADEDPLTGLANYRLFSRALRAETARARRHGGSFTLVLLDLDGFKGVNDELGHQAGDRVLRLTARALRGALREEDVLCRQGGDEFAVIAVQAGRDEALELTERLGDAVAGAMGQDFGRLITASAGAATFGEDAETAEELIHRADEALRGAKRDRKAARALGRGEPPPPENARVTAEPIAPAPERAAGGNGQPEPAAPAHHERRATRGHLTILSALARALSGARDAPSVASTAVAHLAGAIDGTGAAIHRWDRGRHELELAAFSGRLPGGTGGRRISEHNGILGLVVREARAVILSDPRSDVAGIAAIPSARSELAVPVPVGNEVWGALHVVSDQPAAYGPADLALAEAMAEQIGRALACVWVVTRLEQARAGEVDWLAAAVSPWDGTRNLADLAERVGRRAGLPDAELPALRLAALFHDIGTVAVPSRVLGKPGRLTEEERAAVREHVIAGERVLRRVPHLREAADVVRHSHERFDGTGYPDGLAGEEIPLVARVLLACDAYVAMISERPYRDPLTPAAALSELRRVAGSQLDPGVVDALLAELGPAAAPAAGPAS